MKTPRAYHVFAAFAGLLGLYGVAANAIDEVWRTAAYYGTHAAIIPNLSHSIMVDTHWRRGADALHEWIVKEH